MIDVTETAAHAVMASAASNDCDGMPLRIAARREAVGGIQYQMGFDDPREGDAAFESNGVTVLVDPLSRPLLNGLVLDFGELEGVVQFVFINPNDTPDLVPD